MTNLPKKSLKWLLYLSAIFFTILSMVFFGDENRVFAFGCLVISFVAYSSVIIKDLKFLSVVAYITLVLSILSILGIAGGNVSSGNFATADHEKTYYLTLGILMVCIIPFCTYLITAGGWRKKLSLLFLIVSVGLSFVMGAASPSFHTNFVYTRIFIVIILVYSVYSIFRKEKLPRIGGIIGMLASLGALVFSAIMFSAQIYTIEGTEREKVINFIEPKVQEMFQSYNQGNFKNFCHYCREDLKSGFSEEDLKSLQSMYGKYISYEEPTITRVAGSYHIDYIVKFEKINPIYFTLMTEQVEPESTIYRFGLSPEGTIE